ncbi:MarR family transcriptional regulator [Pseudonocardia sp. CNS-139]|nr:MarR family transcriptional regulator [Pseudonocardia sp. CNS-139]
MVALWGRRDPDLDVSALEVVGRVLRLAELVESAIGETLRPLALSYSDFDVLSTLYRLDDAEGTHPRDLARSALITSGAMTARLDRLARAGLVERSADPHDRRAVRVHLTSGGRAVTETAVTRVLAVDESVLAPLGARQREQAAALLRALLAPLDV